MRAGCKDGWAEPRLTAAAAAAAAAVAAAALRVRRRVHPRLHSGND